MSDFKFRCSALGKIVSKSGKLTDTNKTYIQECFIGDKYKVHKEITSKYLDKGIACETEGLTLFNEAFYPSKLVLKNKKHFSNDFIVGTPDIIVGNVIADIKNAYDLFTFGKASLSWDYEWQLKGYMYLTGKTKATLFYCLIDMPDFLLAQEERKLFYSGGFLTTESPDYQEAVKELQRKYVYDYMSKEERFKFWDIELLDTDIKQIESSVTKSREYMDSLELDYQTNITKNKTLLNHLGVLV